MQIDAPDLPPPTDVHLHVVASLEGAESSAWKQRRVEPNGSSTEDMNTWMRSATFTADGTTLIAHDDDNRLHTIFPPEEPRLDASEPHAITCHASFRTASSLLSFTPHSRFQSHDSLTTWVALGVSNLPIQIRNALNYEMVCHSYPWVHHSTEVFQGANALAFLDDGSYFAAGTRGRLAVFSTERPGQAPVIDRQSSLHMTSTYTQKDRGLVMALAASDNGMLAAGTTNRNVTLFASCGQGEAITSFSLAAAPGKVDDCPGTGVSTLIWSPCQRFLLVAERQSDAVQVFDIRNSGNRLAYLSGRNALSTQRFNISTTASDSGYHVWAGGTDGMVRRWSSVGHTQGKHKPSFLQQLSHAPVGSINWRSDGQAMAATCGGYTTDAGLMDSENSDSDSDDELPSLGRFRTLGIWTAR